MCSWTDLFATLNTDGMQKHLFYVDGSGRLLTVNASDVNATWGIPVVVWGNTAASGSPALAACWSLSNINGIRVYLGLQAGSVLEIGYDFAGNNSWVSGTRFSNGDADSGLACVMSGNSTDNYVNLYMRDRNSGNLLHYYELNSTRSGASSHGWVEGM